MKYQVWFNLILFIEDKEHMIDVKTMSREFNEFLFKVGDISFVESKLLKRIDRKGDVVFADAISSLDVPKMIAMIKPKYFLEQSDEDLMAKYPDIKVPKRNSVSGECHAGPFRHTFSIDRGVKPLVDAVNRIKHVRTFASCDGHGQRCLYVSFRVYKRGIEPKILKLLDEAFTEVYPKYNFPVGPFKVAYNVSYTDYMFNRMKLYFYIKVDYCEIDREILFKYITDVSGAIERRVK
jgi:hypothetical protein